MVVDDDFYLLAAIKQTLLLNGFAVQTFQDPEEALAAAGENTFAAVVADVKMPKMDGIELFERLQSVDPELPVIIITGHGDVKMAVHVMKKGAYDFLEKPVDENILIASVERAFEKRLLVMENRHLSERLKKQRRASLFRGLIGAHPAMQNLYEIIEAVAEEDDPVMLYGETGTGKELVARAIHDAGKRSASPFVAVNMGAMPIEMIESEMFGHVKGAFTGAIQKKVGKFAYAGAGTLFLDEICSMPINVQTRLLRVLEEKSVTPLGSNESIPVKARIIAATNRNLEEEIEGGAFRQDLYFRLNVLPVKIPALRDKKEDIPLLIEHFRLEYCRDREQNIEPFSERLIKELQEREWPGNIRELRNNVRRLCVFPGQIEGREKDTDHGNSSLPISGKKKPLKTVLEKTEKEYIVKALQNNKGCVASTHAQLGISRKSLYEKVKKYAIDLASIRKEGN